MALFIAKSASPLRSNPRYNFLITNEKVLSPLGLPRKIPYNSIEEVLNMLERRRNEANAAKANELKRLKHPTPGSPAGASAGTGRGWPRG